MTVQCQAADPTSCPRARAGTTHLCGACRGSDAMRSIHIRVGALTINFADSHIEWSPRPTVVLSADDARRLAVALDVAATALETAETIIFDEADADHEPARRYELPVSDSPDDKDHMQ